MNNNPIETSKASANGWTDDDKKLIAAMVYPMAEMQKAYGRKLDVKLLMRGWEMVLADKWNGPQICYALKEYAIKGGDDFPSPKNLADILVPTEPKITEAQYVQACKAQERNNFPIFSEDLDIIHAYRKQNDEVRENFHIENDKIAALVSGSYNRMIEN